MKDINHYIIEGNLLRKAMIEEVTSSDDSSEDEPITTSDRVTRNLQNYIDCLMSEFKDYPETSTEYRFLH